MWKGKKVIDITGMKFGRLIAIKPTNIRRGRGIVWSCICDCGKEHLTSSISLRKGICKSCGCLKRYLTSERMKLEENLASFNNLMYKYKQGAKERNIAFTLSKEDFKQITKQNCYYCGIEPKQIRKDRLHLNGDYVHNGIDRLDSSRGYILENCVPCCKVCNYAKRNMSVNDFLNWIKKVYNYNLEREL